MTLQMGIIKVEVKIPELVKAIELFKNNNQKLFETITSEIKSSVSNTLNQLLQTEMDLFLGQADQSSNKKNGFYEREFAIKNVGCVRIRMPRDRNKKFTSSLVPKNEQIDSKLKEDLAVLHLAGISNRTLAMVSKRILGVEIGKSTVHIKQNGSESTIETMKSMNVSEDVVKQVQQKIESEARDKVQSVMGHAGYETYD